MKKYYHITTAYGEQLVTDEQGYVLNYSNGLIKDENSENRKSWQITGAYYEIGFGHIRTISLFELNLQANLKLKNGKPKYGLTDIDHGTPRLQGNKQYHGVRSIYVSEKKEN